MALIKCPECQHDISNTAINCPNCGCNIKKAQKAQADILAKEQWDKMPKKEKTIATIITLVIIAVVTIFLFKACSNTDPSKQNHHDGKCDICGKTATFNFSNAEYCNKCFDDFMDWVDKEQKK